MKNPKNAEECAKMLGDARAQILQLRHDCKIERKNVAEACQTIAARTIERDEARRLHAKIGKTMLEYERLLLIAANNAHDSDEEDSFERQILEAINRK